MSRNRIEIPESARSFRHDPRMRQALARLGGQRPRSAVDPAGTSIYWLLRCRRPRLAALHGHPAPSELLIIACALADANARLAVEPTTHTAIHQSLSSAGLDWILRSGECLPCVNAVKPCDVLIVGQGHGNPAEWTETLDRDALVLGLADNRSQAMRMAATLEKSGLAGELAHLRDERRHLVVGALGND